MEKRVEDPRTALKHAEDQSQWGKSPCSVGTAGGVSQGSHRHPEKPILMCGGKVLGSEDKECWLP